MHDIAFLITNRYQIRHFAPIARALPSSATFVIEVRDEDFGVDRSLILDSVPGAAVDWVHKRDLSLLDGRFDLIISQTPVLPQVFLSRSLVVAQQYSLAKERYQYGVWRSLADLNLMFGPHSVEQVEGFSNARAVGNPMFDSFFERSSPADTPAPSPPIGDLKVLYLPTYGSLTSTARVAEHLRCSDVEVTVKLHHMTGDLDRRAIPESWKLMQPDADPVGLIAAADVVISDYSGAAFDAAYVRRPLILVDGVPPSAADLGRLSVRDLDRSALGSLSIPFDPSRPLAEVAEAARVRIEDPSAYLAFVDRHFVHHGQAAVACVEAIIDLLETGPSEQFGRTQVRHRNRDLMLRNRELNDQVRRLRAANDRLRSAPGRRISRRTTEVARRGRLLLARSPRVERRAVRLKQRAERALAFGRSANNEIASSVIEVDHRAPAPTPSSAREALAERIRLLSEKAALMLPSVDVDGFPHFALMSTDKPDLVALVHELAGEFPNLLAVTRLGAKPANKLREFDLQPAQHLELEYSTEQWSTRVSICFTSLRQSSGRVLALDTRSVKVDWTREFDLAPREASQTVRRISRSFDGPIDVVYTWVDSSDKVWQAERHRYSDNAALPPSANNDERFLDRDELRYSLRSLWMYAPFIRKIHVVTNGRVPSWLDLSHERIEVTTHDSIFPDPGALPTFNSHAIEACLHRVPGLAEHFVYLNDDFFLGQEITAGDLFSRAGLPRARFAPSQFVLEGTPPDDAIPTDWAAYNVTRLIERDFGMAFDRKHQHVPYALTVSLLEELEQRYPEEFDRTRRARFRSATDLAVPSMLAPYFAVASGRAIEWATRPRDYVYADTGRPDAGERFAEIIKTRPKFFCLNSTLHVSIELVYQAIAISALLTQMYPEMSPYEVQS